MKHHQSPWIIMSISGLCTIGHIFMILCDVCFKYRFYNAQPQSVMCLKEGPINTAVQQDGHRDMKTCLDRNVKTVKNPQTLKLGVATRFGLFSQADTLLLSLGAWKLSLPTNYQWLSLSIGRLNNQPSDDKSQVSWEQNILKAISARKHSKAEKQSC